MTIITARTMFNCITKLFVDASKGYQLDDINSWKKNYFNSVPTTIGSIDWPKYKFSVQCYKSLGGAMV